MKWESIDTAPRDGSTIILYDTERNTVTTGCVYGNGDAFGHSYPVGWQIKPTHWMPAPNPPSDQAQPTTKPTCGCNPETGTVCPACQVMAEKNVAEMADYVNDFITKRFPSGLNGDIRRIITEIIIDVFHDGARWCEQTLLAEQHVIVDPNQEAQPSIILTPR